MTSNVASLYRGEELKGGCRKRCKEEKESTNIDNTTRRKERDASFSTSQKKSCMLGPY
jgi:hypothetical protein